jgi:hypothetical protein
MPFQKLNNEEDILRLREAVSSLRIHHLERLEEEHTGVAQLINRIAHRN